MTSRSSRGRTTAAAAAAALLSLALAAPPATAATGDVLTFGGDSFGQLGNGSEGAHVDPRVVARLSGASDVAGGREHALALVGGTVWAWGSDVNGAVGNGQPLANVQAPVSVLSGAIAVTTGHYHSLALRSGGGVSAWGFNSRGQIGPAGGASTKVAAPVTVNLPGAATQIAAGRAHSIALIGGAVYTWGDNGFGQLGLGSADNARHSTPQRVAGLPDIRFIAGGRDTTFAIATNGDLWVWGNSQYGQAGTGISGTGAKVLQPKKVLTGVRQVESGADHTVAVRTDGTVWSWGRNRYGQLGYAGGNRSLPKQVTGVPAASKAFVGRDHSLAVATDGRVLTWGRNDGGQLGRDPGVSQSSTPTVVPALAGARDAGGGQVYSVVLR